MALDLNMLHETLSSFKAAYAETQQAGAKLTDFDIRRLMFDFWEAVKYGRSTFLLHIPPRLQEATAEEISQWVRAVTEWNACEPHLGWAIVQTDTGFNIQTGSSSRGSSPEHGACQIVKQCLNERAANGRADDELTSFDLERMLYETYMNVGYLAGALEYSIPERDMRHPLLWNWRAKIVWEELLIQDETIRLMLDPQRKEEGNRILCQTRGSIDAPRGIFLMFTPHSYEYMENECEFDPEVWPQRGVPTAIRPLL